MARADHFRKNSANFSTRPLFFYSTIPSVTRLCWPSCFTMAGCFWPWFWAWDSDTFYSDTFQWKSTWKMFRLARQECFVRLHAHRLMAAIVQLSMVSSAEVGDLSGHSNWIFCNNTQAARIHQRKIRHVVWYRPRRVCQRYRAIRRKSHLPSARSSKVIAVAVSKDPELEELTCDGNEPFFPRFSVFFFK